MAVCFFKWNKFNLMFLSLTKRMLNTYQVGSFAHVLELRKKTITYRKDGVKNLNLPVINAVLRMRFSYSSFKLYTTVCFAGFSTNFGSRPGDGGSLQRAVQPAFTRIFF